MEERRSGRRCPQCHSKQVEMMVQRSTISYQCIACNRGWPERRQSALASATIGFSDRDTHAAVEQICAAVDLDGVIAETRRWARRLTDADGVTFVLRAGDSCYYADEEAIAPLWKGQRFPLSACVSGWVMLNRESVMIPDIYADERVPHDAYRPTFVRSMLMVPVRRADPIAAIGAYWKNLCAPLPAHVQLVELLAEAAAVRLQSEQLWSRVRDEFNGGR
jgi:GAF domain-containing protein